LHSTPADVRSGEENPMTAKALEIPPLPYTGEKARLTRAYDYLILVLALFLFIGAFIFMSP